MQLPYFIALLDDPTVFIRRRVAGASSGGGGPTEGEGSCFSSATPASAAAARASAIEAVGTEAGATWSTASAVTLLARLGTS